MKIDLSRVEWMRQQAIAIQELTRGLPTPITDNALKSAIEMGNYVQELAQIIQTIQPQGDVDEKALAEEQVREGVAMIYNFANPPKTWEQCYKEFAEKEFAQHRRLWIKFLELQSSAKEFTAEDMIKFATSYFIKAPLNVTPEQWLTEYRKRGGK